MEYFKSKLSWLKEGENGTTETRNFWMSLHAMLQEYLNYSEHIYGIVSNGRHYKALRLVAESLSEVIDGLQTNLSEDLLAIDIKPSLHYLGELTGEVTNEDQLDYIFSKFCIGK